MGWRDRLERYNASVQTSLCNLLDYDCHELNHEKLRPYPVKCMYEIKLSFHVAKISANKIIVPFARSFTLYMIIIVQGLA